MDQGTPEERRDERARPKGVLAALHIRKKLILLHTLFSALLAVTLLVALQPAIRDLIRSTELNDCRMAFEFLGSTDDLSGRRVSDVDVTVGDSAALSLSPVQLAILEDRGEAIESSMSAGCRVIRPTSNDGEFIAVSTKSAEARRSVMRIYVLMAASLIGVYSLIALSLEVFVLPRQVYEPIRRLLRADAAVRRGDRNAEMIPESGIPADELGEIMRSRNDVITQLRSKELALSNALEQLEVIASDMKRKNFLLEATRRNMADQDRLASLGMMSAGLAHEMNTPLTVLKGSVERLAESPASGVDPEQAALMLRVVHRLERLSESLLDFARVRPPQRQPVRLRSVVKEAWTLVQIDREARSVEMRNEIEESLELMGDPDRLTQVFVNLTRNAVDAMDGAGAITITAESTMKEGRRWLSILCKDNGPGIDPIVLPRLFEPFISTRLDARGAGLGLAVAEGIVREHEGALLAHNDPAGGAVFEVLLPVDASENVGPVGSGGGREEA